MALFWIAIESASVSLFILPLHSQVILTATLIDQTVELIFLE